MKGPWKVTCTPIGDERLYAAVRIIDTRQVDHSGNREMAGEWTTNRLEALDLADRLNAEEGR